MICMFGPRQSLSASSFFPSDFVLAGLYSLVLFQQSPTDLVGSNHTRAPYLKHALNAVLHAVKCLKTSEYKSCVHSSKINQPFGGNICMTYLKVYKT